jgi:hypothetical protein
MSTAWFQVDLGSQYNIDNVTIYYRREGTVFNSFLFIKLYEIVALKKTFADRS